MCCSEQSLLGSAQPAQDKKPDSESEQDSARNKVCEVLKDDMIQDPMLLRAESLKPLLAVISADAGGIVDVHSVLLTIIVKVKVRGIRELNVGESGYLRLMWHEGI